MNAKVKDDFETQANLAPNTAFGKRCEHGVYNPDGEARYCTICTPVTIKGKVLKRIKTSVGPLTLVVETEQVPLNIRRHWENKLEAHNLGVDQGAIPDDGNAIWEYFIDNDIAIVSDEELVDGFQVYGEEE